MKRIFVQFKQISLSALLFLVIIPNGFANYSEPLNYYNSAPTNLLDNIEKYHLAQGIEKLQQGKYEYAWSEFAFILHYFPNHPKALEKIGDLSIQMEAPQRAARYFERAIKLFPEEADTYDIYGAFLYKIGKLDDAIQQYKMAVNLDAEESEYHYHLGLAYFASKEYHQALKEALQAYDEGFPELDLKNKLMSVKAWPHESSHS